MTVIEHPFHLGTEVAIQVRSGWNAPYNFKRARVAKVHKSGNFTLEDSPQQWRPYAPSSYEKFWRAGATGPGGGVLWIIDDSTRGMIAEQNVKAGRYHRYTKARSILDREPFSERVTDDVLEKLEYVVAALKPAKFEAA